MQRSYITAMSSIVPMGVVGASLLLGSVLPGIAMERPASIETPVSDRLAAIREAVFIIGSGDISKEANRNFRLTWGNRWNNWGWRGRPGRLGPASLEQLAQRLAKLE
jgi:hypothetical protein